MEAILYIIGIYGGIALIGWIFSTISNAFKKHREKIRDQVATEVLSGWDIENVIENYKQKLAHIKYSKTDPIHGQIERMKEQIYGSTAVLMSECPQCKEGHLVLRKGKFGKFMGCTKYPKCDYTSKLEAARAEYKKSINEQFIDDMRQAYLKI
jgi:hypothetical protein